MSGKGSKQRPCLVPEEIFERNWIRIFGTEKQKEELRKTEAFEALQELSRENYDE